MGSYVEHRTFTNVRKQWRPYIQNMLMTDERALLKALIVVYNNQTADERSRGMVSARNKIGFTKNDAKVLTILAEKYLRNEELTNVDKAVIYDRMPKYWRQIMFAIMAKDLRTLQQKEEAVKEQDEEFCIDFYLDDQNPPPEEYEWYGKYYQDTVIGDNERDGVYYDA